MRTCLLALLVPCFLLFGCPTAPTDDDDEPVDTDGDGLTDDEEADLGTDPEVADTDGDGLTDGEEADLGTDGTLADTDGDTYSDYQEDHYGSDPLDADDRIYTGYWPYNTEKDAIEGLDLNQSLSVGDIHGHFVGPDQFEEDVDIYDYAGQGVYTLVDVSAGWCGYCQEWAALLAGMPSYFDSWGEFDELDTVVNDGRLQWVTILSQNAQQGPPSVENSQNWDSAWPNDNVPVLADLDQVMMDHFDLYGFPTILLVDENMEVVTHDPNDYTVAILEGIERALAMDPVE
jgi:hypothetical protein